MQAAVAMSKRGLNFIGVIKQAHSLFPKDYLQDILQPLPAASRLVLTANVDGQDLVAVGYKYNRRKVLFFVSTAGVADITDGEPYVQRWADEHMNLCTREVPRPALISRYFSDSPKVDNHNQSRQHDLALEELWLTQDCWFRLHTTLQGILATDVWKLIKHHVSQGHKYKEISINDFSDKLANRLIHNNLNNGVKPTKSTARRQELPASAREPLAGHYPVLMERNQAKKKTKQLQCLWCLRINDTQTSYTSYECSVCRVPLCCKNNRSTSRDCFDVHCRASPAEVAILTTTSKKRGRAAI